MPRRLAIFILAMLSVLPYSNLLMSMAADEAVLTFGSDRILNGEWIYRDWNIHISPGSFLIGTAWFGICGFNAPSPTILFGIIFALTALLIDACSQHCLTGRWRWLPTALWCTLGAVDFPILSYHWMASGAALATVLSIFHWVEKPTPARASLVGLAVASAGWLLQSEGLVTVLMVALCWLRLRPAGLHWTVLSCFICSLVLWAPMLPQIAQFVKINVELGGHLNFNRSLYSWANWLEFSGHYSDLSPSLGFVNFWGQGSHLLLNAVRYLGFPLCMATVFWVAERRRDRAAQILGYCMLAWLLGTHNRHTTLYVAFLTPGWLLLFARTLQQSPKGAWLAGVFLACEAVGWPCRILIEQKTHIYPISTRRGVLYSSNPYEAASANLILQKLQSLPPKTPVFVFPYGMQYYWMADLTNPTRSMTLFPGLNSDAEVAAVQQALKNQAVEWLLYVPVDVNAIARTIQIDPEGTERQLQTLLKTLTADYEVDRRTPGLVLYRRRSVERTH